MILLSVDAGGEEIKIGPSLELLCTAVAPDIVATFDIAMVVEVDAVKDGVIVLARAVTSADTEAPSFFF
jgi:hypothetical protein